MKKFIEIYLAIATNNVMFFCTLIIGPPLFCIFLITATPVIGYIASGALIFVVVMAMKASKSEDAKIKNKMENEVERINNLHGTNFTLNQAYGGEMTLFIDPDKEKFMFLNRLTNKCVRVENYNFIKTWHLTWNEKPFEAYSTIIYSDIEMKLTTSDINMPIIRMTFNKKQSGERLDAVLRALLT